MKSRLFWKILLGFWFTFICIMQGVWIAYAMVWGDQDSFDREMSQVIAPYQLSAARLAIESGGLPAYQALQSEWRELAGHVHDRWGVQQAGQRLAVVPADDAAARVAGTAGAVAGEQRVLAIDPEARAWEIIHTLPADEQPYPEDEGWRELLGFYLPAEWAIPGALGGLLFSALLAWYLARPIQKLRNGLRKLADGQLDTRLRPDMGRRRDEIADLASDFDRMAESQQQLLLAREQLLHDVSHELRSPLARLNLVAALADQGMHSPEETLLRIKREVGRLDELVGELLSLSRRESGAADTDAYFDMRVLLEALVADVSFEARARGIDLVLHLLTRQPTLIQGSAELIRRALENVARNAIQYSKHGDTVDMSLALHEDQRRIVVTVTDHGPGVPKADLARMFEPFVRLGSNRGEGYGLGLAIASRAVHSHQGSIEAANRPEGGLAVTVVLPQADMTPEMMRRIFEIES